MAVYHSLLLRQLARLGIAPDDPELASEPMRRLLERVSRAYEDADKGHYLLRRAQELSSHEVGQLYSQLKEAQRVAGLGTWSFTATPQEGQWSEECARLFGIDPVAPMPRLRELLERVHQAGRKDFAKAIDAALAKARPFELELRLLRDDGRACWIVVVGRAVRDPGGEVQRLHGTVMDITRRKLTELRQSVEHTVTQLLAEAQSPLDAMPRIIKTLGTTLGWACGAYWHLDEASGTFHRQSTWSASRASPFFAASSDVARRDGCGGLIARTARSGQPTWIADVTEDPDFVRRKPAALSAGLRAAFAFPIHTFGKVVGVIELFDKRIQCADPDLLATAQSLGRQIGQYLHRKQAEDHIHHLAFHDALTNLPNRAMFNRQLSRAIAQATRYGKRLAVLFIDLDRFKVINDTLGHDAGDRLLQEMARRLGASLRQGDMLTRLEGEDGETEVLARLGGDEFVVLVEEVTEASRVAHVASKLLDALIVPYRLDGHAVHVTASIGVALFPEDGSDERTLMKHADIAMYRAKEAGKNNYQFYSARMNQHSHAMLALESDLRYALGRDQFRLHYQAKVDVATGRITGVEALMRWQHPVLGLVHSPHFVSLAEETGLIIPMGKWVLEHACAQSQAWQGQGLPPLHMAVNLSARQFSDDRLLDDIAACLQRSGMDPALLEVEVTESTVMHNPDKVVFVLDGLKHMGVRVAIDDFGVGYSSLAQLKRLPIDIIKVDRSFIRDCPDDAADVAITQAVIGIGRSLNLKVVAEGVETARQLRFVRDSGCHEVQGFLFSPPVTADEFARRYRRSHGGVPTALLPVLDARAGGAVS